MAREVSHRLGDFFSHLSGEYDASILRACPPYPQMLDALISYVFINTEKPLQILELGCGTGNLSQLLAQRFPQCHLTLVDLSGEMLRQAETKLLPLTKDYALVQAGFTDLQFLPESFDLVISSLALHHLLDEEKPSLYEQIFQWLKPGGQFQCADQCLGLPEAQTHHLHTQRWLTWARQNGASEEELQVWMDHATEADHYASLESHFNWLKASGFHEIDCYWKLLFWTVFGARKP